MKRKLIPIVAAFALALTTAACGAQKQQESMQQEAAQEEVELYFIQQTDDDGNESYTYSAESGEYELTASIDEIRSRGCIIASADEIKSAEVKSADGSYQINIQFNDAGTKLFKDATERALNNDRESIGIYYDGRFVSVPVVNDVIADGVCVIAGMADFEEASNLADKLNGR